MNISFNMVAGILIFVLIGAALFRISWFLGEEVFRFGKLLNFLKKLFEKAKK